MNSLLKTKAVLTLSAAILLEAAVIGAIFTRSERLDYIIGLSAVFVIILVLAAVKIADIVDEAYDRGTQSKSNTFKRSK